MERTKRNAKVSVATAKLEEKRAKLADNKRPSKRADRQAIRQLTSELSAEEGTRLSVFTVMMTLSLSGEVAAAYRARLRKLVRQYEAVDSITTSSSPQS